MLHHSYVSKHAIGSHLNSSGLKSRIAPTNQANAAHIHGSVQDIGPIRDLGLVPHLIKVGNDLIKRNLFKYF